MSAQVLTFMTSFHSTCLFKGSISTYSHTEGQGFSMGNRRFGGERVQFSSCRALSTLHKLQHPALHWELQMHKTWPPSSQRSIPKSTRAECMWVKMHTECWDCPGLQQFHTVLRGQGCANVLQRSLVTFGVFRQTWRAGIYAEDCTYLTDLLD